MQSKSALSRPVPSTQTSQEDRLPAPGSVASDTLSSFDVAQYIADMTIDLAAMAGAAKMPMLTYFLHMARVEAELQLHELQQKTSVRNRAAVPF